MRMWRSNDNNQHPPLPPATTHTMATIDERHVSPTFTSLGVQVATSFAISVVSLLAFEKLRRIPSMRQLYSPRCALTRNPSPPPSLVPLGWAFSSLRLSEEFMLNHVGLDAVMHLRFLRSAFLVLLTGSALLAPVLLPLNYGRSGEDEAKVRVNGLNLFSIENIDSGSNLLYAHAVFCYLFTFLIFARFFRDSVHYVNLRRDYGSKRIRDGGLAVRTVMVTGLPRHLRDEDALRDHFQSLQIGPVDDATIVRHPAKLIKKLARRDKALENLEIAHIELAQNIIRYILRRQNAPLSILEARSHSLDLSTSDGLDEEGEIGSALAIDLPHSSLKRYQEQLAVRLHHLIHRPNTESPVATTTWAGSHELQSMPVTRTHSRLSGLLAPAEEQVRRCSEGGIASLGDFWESLSNLPKGVLDRFHPIHRIILPNARWIIPRRKSSEQPRRSGLRSAASGTIPLGTASSIDGVARKKPKSAIDHYVRKFNRMDQRVHQLREAGPRKCAEATATGFVTFRYPASAELCAQAVISRSIKGFQVEMAPEPRDVAWASHAVGLGNRTTRRLITNASVWALTIFWLFPMSFVLYLTSYDTIQKNVPWLAPVLSSSAFMTSLIKDLLPVLITALFLSILPFAVFEISKQEYFLSYSDLEWAVMNRFYRFAFFNVLVVFLLGSGFVTYFLELFKKPTDLIDSLAFYIPTGATYFINYVIFATCIHSLELVQVFVQVVAFSVSTSRWVSKLPRVLQRNRFPYSFPYYYYFPLHILLFVICITYALINPLIMIAGFIYFGIAYIIYKHQFAYSYVRRYEGGGKAWRFAFNFVFDGVTFAQLTMIGVLSLKKVLIAAAALVPLVILTIFARIWLRKKFQQRMKFIPLESLRDANVVVLPRPGMDESSVGVAHDGGRPFVLGEQLESRPRAPSFGSLSVSSTNDESHAGPNRRKREYGGPGIHEELDDSNGDTPTPPSALPEETHTVTREHTVALNPVPPRHRSDTIPEGEHLKPKSRQERASSVLHAVTYPTPAGLTLPAAPLNGEPDARTLMEQVVVVHSRDRRISPLPSHIRVQSEPPLAHIVAKRSTTFEPVQIGMNDSDASRGEEGLSPHSPQHKVKKTRFARDRLQALRGWRQFKVDPGLGLHIRAHSVPPITTIVASLLGKANSEGNAESIASSGELDPPYETRPNRDYYQDVCSDPDIYVHPALVKPLVVHMWLPANPVRKGPVKIDECVELDHALTSSRFRGSGLLGYRPQRSLKVETDKTKIKERQLHRAGEIGQVWAEYDEQLTTEPVNEAYADSAGRHDNVETQSIVTGYTSGDTSGDEDDAEERNGNS